MANIDINTITYKDYGKCIQISNRIVDLLVTVDIGPRIIRFGFIGGNNMFCEKNDETTPSLGGDWKIRGGHRLWHSPEHMPRTYIPDNDPVEWHAIENGICVVSKPEKWTQIQKEMEIKLSDSNSKVKIIHKLINKNAWPVEFAAWSLSVMAPGGIQVIPQCTRETGLLANRVVALWPYAKMNDERVYWGEKYIILKQLTDIKRPFKLGLNNEDGWAAYFNYGNAFIKRFSYIKDKNYPDYGVCYEAYTNDFMMEMESLSPLTLVEPDGILQHEEEWELLNLDKPKDEKDIEDFVNEFIKP